MNSMSARAVKDLDGNISQSCSVKNSLGIFGLGVGYLLFCTVLATWRPLLHQIDFFCQNRDSLAKYGLKINMLILSGERFKQAGC